ncbi:MAG TPA: glycoside hydrolase family 3 N-terminal domain-containing protein [Streptosporangiaceae bacterium]|jgi:beta-N-acetylhexosaminidase
MRGRRVSGHDDSVRLPAAAGQSEVPGPDTGRAFSRRTALLGGASLAVGVMGLRDGQRATAAVSRVRPASLTPQQLAGQRVIFSFSGDTPPASLLQQISAGEAAGVIILTQNVNTTSQVSSAIQQLVSANQASPVASPLLIMTDQEGGEVRRLPGAPTMSEKQIGASSDPAAKAAQAGTGAGDNLAGVGLNVNLAPVLDVYRQPGDFDDQFQRSYSESPSVCGICGQDFISAQQFTGVAATAKHFPGLGAATASQDTDSGPVTLNVSLSDLRNIDEVPYTYAISAGVMLVMCSWAVYPSLDASLPAGLSPTVVGSELRGRLGFTGVTITDALEAGALSAFGSTSQRAVLAATAGMDLLLCASGSVSQGQTAVSALASAYQSGQLGQAAFNASVQRVTALRNSLA